MSRHCRVAPLEVDPNGPGSAGSSYVVFGRRTGFEPIINLSTLGGVTGFHLDGAAESDSSGRIVAGAGDINGDGVDDLIMSAREEPRLQRAGVAGPVAG